MADLLRTARALLVVGGILSLVAAAWSMAPSLIILGYGFWSRGFKGALAWQLVYGWFFLLVGVLQAAGGVLALQAAHRAARAPRSGWRRGLVGGILGAQPVSLIGAFLCRRAWLRPHSE